MSIEKNRKKLEKRIIETLKNIKKEKVSIVRQKSSELLAILEQVNKCPVPCYIIFSSVHSDYLDLPILTEEVGTVHGVSVRYVPVGCVELNALSAKFEYYSNRMVETKCINDSSEILPVYRK